MSEITTREDLIATNWRSLVRPRKIVKSPVSNGQYGKFTISPLERGYGVTIGNSLRRVLLSSLTGAAITSIYIEGVLHEFSSMPNVVEDVTEVVLNLKGVRIKMNTANPVQAKIHVKGQKSQIVDALQILV